VNTSPSEEEAFVRSQATSFCEARTLFLSVKHTISAGQEGRRAKECTRSRGCNHLRFVFRVHSSPLSVSVGRADRAHRGSTSAQPAGPVKIGIVCPEYARGTAGSAASVSCLFSYRSPSLVDTALTYFCRHQTLTGRFGCNRSERTSLG
jgi:hypothetical protein